MQQDYDKTTKDHYKDDDVALDYHVAFTQSGNWNSVRFKMVAWSERNTIAAFLSKVKTKEILDLPAGTGKLAPVFAKLGSNVTACDISPNMLAIAEKEYGSIGYNKVQFQVCDAEKIKETLNRQFDVVVNLRLLHRVPDSVRENVVREVATVAPYAVVSVAVGSPLMRIRKALRGLLFQGTFKPVDPTMSITKSESRSLVSKYGEVVQERRVLYGLSEETIYLIKSNIFTPAKAVMPQPQK